jgi:3-dehydroquinate synthase
MIKTLKLRNNERSESTIYIGIDALSSLSTIINISSYSLVLLLTDSNLPNPLQSNIKRTLGKQIPTLNVVSGDQNKNLETVKNIWDFLLISKADRNSVLVIAGGGVLTDIGCFAASTYMRGMDQVNIPTTLLSQVDAGIGGKNGFNYGGVKNLIGLFRQPKCILIDPSVLISLPQRELISGFAEVIKHGLIYDKEYFDFVTSKQPNDFTLIELATIIERSCQIKCEIVKEDLYEAGQRKVINFGHTVGHAIESISQETDKPLLHGEAISIGMLAEAMMAEAIGILHAEDVDTIKQRLQFCNLPTAFECGDESLIIEKMKFDKKNKNQQINFTLVDSIGHAVTDQIIPETIQSEILHLLGGA